MNGDAEQKLCLWVTTICRSDLKNDPMMEPDKSTTTGPSICTLLLQVFLMVGHIQEGGDWSSNSMNLNCVNFYLHNRNTDLWKWCARELGQESHSQVPTRRPGTRSPPKEWCGTMPRNARNLENVTWAQYNNNNIGKGRHRYKHGQQQEKKKRNITGTFTIFFMCGKIHVFDNDVVN